MSDSILLAYSFDGKGGGARLEDSAVSEQIRADNLAWVHLDAIGQLRMSDLDCLNDAHKRQLQER